MNTQRSSATYLETFGVSKRHIIYIIITYSYLKILCQLSYIEFANAAYIRKTKVVNLLYPFN